MDWNTKFPCRDPQISHLVSVLQEPTNEPACFTITGNESSGKTSVLRYLLDALRERDVIDGSHGRLNYCYSLVNCTQHFSTKSLLEDAIEQICEQAGNTFSLSGRKYGHFSDFVSLLCEINIDLPIYLVFDDADRLGNRHYFEGSLVFNLMRISEWARKKVMPLFVSRIPFSLYTKGCYPEPRDVYFSPYTQEEVTTIIMGYHALPGCDRTLFNCLSRLVVRACWNRCSDLRELIRATQHLYPILEQPVANHEIQKEAFSTLYARILPHIQRVYSNIYRRDKDTRIPYVTTESGSGGGAGGGLDTPAVQGKIKVLSEGDLPYCTKYVLLACYLASVIPASHDQYIFSSSSSSGKKSDLPKKGEGTNVSRIFTQQRLLMIFSKIIKGKISVFVGPVNIRFEIASLVAQNFLTPCGGGDGIPKFQFNTYDSLFIQKLAQFTAFDLNNYLAMLY